MKRQADKASLPQVELHIKRQRKLGQRMIGDFDRPGWPDLIVTAGLLLLMLDMVNWVWP